MNWIDSVVPWSARIQSRQFDYLRVLLGLFIVFKGVMFTLDISAFFASFKLIIDESILDELLIFSLDLPELQVISLTGILILSILMSTYVITAHLIGGVLLILGLFTRWICLIEFPILIGAVFLVNLPQGSSSLAGIVELGTSILVLLGLIYFFIHGAGKKSIDELRRKDLQYSDT